MFFGAGLMLMGTACASEGSAQVSPAGPAPVKQVKTAVVTYHQQPADAETLLQSVDAGKCPDCGGELHAVLQNSEELPLEETKCISYAHGTDAVTTLNISYVLRCDTCKKDIGAAVEDTFVQSNECHGWN